MCLIIHEARKSGGRGWLDYDILFRQHAAAHELEGANTTLDWTRLDSSLHASYLAGQRDLSSQVCSTCSAPDHSDLECASTTPLCIQWNKGECRHENCRYRHTCASCPGLHRACECPQTSRDSFFKRAAARAGPSGAAQQAPHN